MVKQNVTTYVNVVASSMRRDAKCVCFSNAPGVNVPSATVTVNLWKSKSTWRTGSAVAPASWLLVRPSIK